MALRWAVEMEPIAVRRMAKTRPLYAALRRESTNPGLAIACAGPHEMVAGCITQSRIASTARGRLQRSGHGVTFPTN